jgi:hypothetical protein
VAWAAQPRHDHARVLRRHSRPAEGNHNGMFCGRGRSFAASNARIAVADYRLPESA